ncbi:MAG: hypothetical protein ABR499_15560 [Gemmatimonadaceae bacterium]
MDEKRNSGLGRRAFLRETFRTAAFGVGALSVGRFGDLLTRLEPHYGSRVNGRSPLGRNFNMLVLGDSIMWGQGLLDHQKFSYGVQQWVRQRLPGIGVDRHVFAHSGATISPQGAGPDDPSTDAHGFVEWHGEYPRSRMSITYQVGWARDALRSKGIAPEDVDLVLMDGGINDVEVTSILNPNPIVGSGLIRQLTEEKVYHRMNALLPRVKSTFPTATIVITSYFPIVSYATPVLEIAGLLSVLGFLGVAVSPLVRDKLASQSVAFDEASRKFLQLAVDIANGYKPPSMTPRPAPVPGSPGEPDVSSGDPVQDMKQAASTATTGPRPQGRVVFTPVPWKSTNSYGASESWLWRVGYPDAPDPVATERVQVCTDLHRGLDPRCRSASMGHPNISGAQTYAAAIIASLERFVPEWQQKFPPIPALPTIAVTVQGTIAHDQLSTITVLAADAKTRAPVQGEVLVGGQSAQTGQPITGTFCQTAQQMPTTSRPMPTKLQREQGIPIEEPTPTETTTRCQYVEVRVPGYAIYRAPLR